ncbi:hypothetical protein [Paenibacillus riograndensis]|uniref:Uncharacterized protein n=2 Tax=Paenibacillus riograndensis TaxID=483937 RepID=A0A132UBY8_9BACL|nr:hypothetical protein [Paenibacillus riograndensis]KWX81052.1 hypothetical protein AMQ84_01310 [Paenibacillus riograndensis]CQR57002.1 hypothetical protein PRIO_4600 [Paenibacillus riograndensis SBR5]
MEDKQVFMRGYINKDIKITFLDNLYVTGVYVDYYYSNNVIVLVPEDGHDDARLLIPLSAIKTLAPWIH